MAYRVTWNEYENDPAYSAGTAVGDLIRGAGQLYCQVIKNYPRWSLSNPLGLDPFSRAINDRLCAGPLPPSQAPVLPPPGGQCTCVLYDVTWSGVDTSGPVGATNRVAGPVSAPFWHPTVPGSDLFALGFQYGSEGCGGVDFVNIVANVAENQIDQFSMQLNAIARVDGQPDLCGSIPPQAPVEIPPLGDLSITVPVNIYPSVDINIPVTITRPDPSKILPPGGGGNYNFAPVFNFPDLNINLNFDLGGINLFFGGGNVRNPVETLPDPRGNGKYPSLPPSQECDLSLVLKQLEKIYNFSQRTFECACPPTPPLLTQSYPAAQSRSVVLPADTYLVVLELQALGPNARITDGGSAPDVVQAGWAWFADQDGNNFERQYIDSYAKSFQATPLCRGFSYTCWSGTTAALLVYYEGEDP